MQDTRYRLLVIDNKFLVMPGRVTAFNARGLRQLCTGSAAYAECANAAATRQGAVAEGVSGWHVQEGT